MHAHELFVQTRIEVSCQVAVFNSMHGITCWNPLDIHFERDSRVLCNNNI